MKFYAAGRTDIGIKREVNQDSFLILQAQSKLGGIGFAAVCDGMGGLMKGELASAELISMLDRWFTESLPEIIAKDFTEYDIFDDWNYYLSVFNSRLTAFCISEGYPCGTTVSAVLVIGDRFYVVNVGDSRVYLISSDGIDQLTHDDTFVQHEIDEGRLTPQQALRDKRRNILTQCIGMAGNPDPGFISGKINDNELFLVCSDGFRHVITEDELRLCLAPEKITSDNEIGKRLELMIDEIKHRGETDNITAATIMPILSDDEEKSDFRVTVRVININTDEKIDP